MFIFVSLLFIKAFNTAKLWSTLIKMYVCEEICTSFRVMKMTRTVFENKVAISTQKTVCNKMSNRIQTDKVYLNAMLEVTGLASNLDQYLSRDVIVTKVASNVRLIIVELERVVFCARRPWAKGTKARK